MAPSTIRGPILARWTKHGRAPLTDPLTLRAIPLPCKITPLGLPPHHGLRPSSRAFGNRGGTTACGNLVQRQEAFAAARMGGTQGQMAQIRNRLAPALMVNS